MKVIQKWMESLRKGSKVIEKRGTPLIRDNHLASHCEIKLQGKTLLHVAGKSLTRSVREEVNVRLFYKKIKNMT